MPPPTPFSWEASAGLQGTEGLAETEKMPFPSVFSLPQRAGEGSFIRWLLGEQEVKDLLNMLRVRGRHLEPDG